MENQLKFYINGEWVDPSTSDTLEVINPATEQPITSIAMGGPADVDKAVAAAKAAFETYSQTSREERVALLEKIIAAYTERLGEVAETISQEMGAPLPLANAAQAPAGLGHFMTILEVLKNYEFEEDIGGSHIVREPAGVCGFITPWNWPINQIACKVAPALAAGCTMILKPSEVAPLNAILFAEVMDAAGVPPGVFNLVNGDGPTVGAALSAHPDVDMMSFTGSTRAGIEVARNAAPTVKRVAQELGGKSANIILDDADFDAAISRDVFGLCMNSGQSCNAPTRMLVPNARMDEAAAIAKAAAENVKVGDPTAEGTTIGPVVSAVQFEKIQNLIEKGIEEGAKLETGGPGRPDGLNVGYFVKPTVFSHVTNDMTIAREEIFGPVLSLIGYEDDDDAVRIANDTPYGLSGYVSSGDPERAKAIARRLRTGNVHLNGAPVDNNSPFGGYKQSGNGREWGKYGFEEFLEIKAIMGYNVAG
ncbi:MAG: aldehyde dehydrogenase family protein [Gammaproteobacteria bacterium]|nr:MAG: aldehyde dehydrogenase family protein [Gammaproteobacteria bacterium]TDJ37230.1 MAG: aldehyde dehydrogenase family protein [Gammaproteobacteria bacterium]TDJ49159.1 MAG: aldehyde dehydrogenase family protein [Gemmatimonadota bacterium]